MNPIKTLYTISFVLAVLKILELIEIEWIKIAVLPLSGIVAVAIVEFSFDLVKSLPSLRK